MSLSLPAFPTRRLVLVRFTRGAPAGDPLLDAPDIDERGYLAPFQGPVVSVAAGRTVKVGLQRFFLETRTALFAESSDPAIMRLANPVTGALPPDLQTTISFTGVDGGSDSRTAALRIRIGSITGPIIHQLNVVVFRPVSVRVTPHLVTVSSSSRAGTLPVVDIPAVMQKVGDIWTPAGVTFTVQPTRRKTFVFKRADIVENAPTPGEMATLCATRMPDGTPNWIPNTINVFFIVEFGEKSLFGLGFSRAAFKSFGMPNPAIILADRSGTISRTGAIQFAQTLAHEFGHFFTLNHAGGGQIPNEREDTWSRRMLMHPFSPTIRAKDPFPINDGDGKPFTQRPRFNDIGYGNLASGCLLTLKDLPQFTGDGECFTARAAITSPQGPF